MSNYDDRYQFLDQEMSLNEKLGNLHDAINEKFPFVERLAVTLHDAETDLLRTFLASDKSGRSLDHYSYPLSELTWLSVTAANRKRCVINDLSLLDPSNRQHAQHIQNSGYRSSYTVPMWQDDHFYGFIFFNSSKTNAFQHELLEYLSFFARLVTQLVIAELQAISALRASVKTLQGIARYKDPETAAHLERLSRYSRLIAEETAERFDLTDEWIEHLFMFSALHDIGKLAIPDHVLLKPTHLTQDEYEQVKLHPTKGLEIIDQIVDNFGHGKLQHIDMLRNIVLHHHESWDGSGYPHGLEGTSIPLEARMVAVVDVFDALTSERPYKKAWSNEVAFSGMMKMVDIKLERSLVEVMIANESQIKKIQHCFNDESNGTSTCAKKSILN